MESIKVGQSVTNFFVLYFKLKRQYLESRNVNQLATSVVRSWGNHYIGENILQMVEGGNTVTEALLK